jgi:hypothetical protein
MRALRDKSGLRLQERKGTVEVLWPIISGSLPGMRAGTFMSQNAGENAYFTYVSNAGENAYFT